MDQSDVKGSFEGLTHYLVTVVHVVGSGVVLDQAYAIEWILQQGISAQIILSVLQLQIGNLRNRLILYISGLPLIIHLPMCLFLTAGTPIGVNVAQCFVHKGLCMYSGESYGLFCTQELLVSPLAVLLLASGWLWNLSPFVACLDTQRVT